MWDFFDRLLNIALPRVRDFRGLSQKAFDGRGNYSVGIREEIIFPEIDFDKLEKALGLGVVINTTAKTDEEGRAPPCRVRLPVPEGMRGSWPKNP